MERRLGINEISQRQQAQEFIQQTSYQESKEAVGVFQGGLNDSLVFKLGARENADRVILRFPKPDEDRTITHSAIQQEYDAIGATENGVGFRLRTIKEQAEFMQRTNMIGLKTLNYIYIKGFWIFLVSVS